jgi:outer membrane immunogenic protein
VLKHLLAATTALAALSSTVMAADLPSRRAPVPYVAVPVFTWTGFYIGGNAGYITSDSGDISTRGNNGPAAGPSTIFNVSSGARPGLTRLEANGFTGGGQIGYNQQIGNFVFGLEADAAYTDHKKTINVIGATGAQSTFRTDMSYIGTVRGRLGYAFDRFLVYGTGGFAYGDVQNTATFFATPAAGGTGVVQFAGRRSSMETGYVAGGGIEYALPTSFSLFGSNAVTLKAEGLYYDLGNSNVVVGDTGRAPAATRGQSYTSRFDNTGVIARAGLNFKFGTF